MAGIRPEMEKAVAHFTHELARLRTGQATPALVEDVPVDAYGQRMPLKQLASISVPERRQIVVQPWDPACLGPIEKALQKSELGASPVVDQGVVRVRLPQLTAEFREDLVRTVEEKGELARQTLRRWRDEAWGEIQKRTREGEIREDDKFRGKEALQKLIDEMTGKIEDQLQRKMRELREG